MSEYRIPRGQTNRQSALLYRAALCSSPTQPLSLSIASRVYPATVRTLHLDTSRRRQIQTFLSQWLMACAIETALGPSPIHDPSSFFVVRFLDRFPIFRCARQCSTTNNTTCHARCHLQGKGTFRSDSHLHVLVELYIPLE
jgi:hypothetical protein